MIKAYSQEVGTPSVLGAFKASRGRGFLSDFVALEVLAGLGKHRRSGHLSRGMYRTAVSEFSRDFPSAFNVVEVDEAVRRHAFALAQALHREAVGAMDLLHLASALHVLELVRPRPLVFACVDGPLRKAAAANGLHTFNPERDPLSNLLGLLR